MDQLTALIVAIGVIIGCGIIARVVGHHIITMVIGIAGFAGAYLYSFWIVGELALVDYLMMIFFLLVFLFGRIKFQLEGRGENQDEHLNQEQEELTEEGENQESKKSP